MAAPVKFTRHPPERRRSGSIVLAMGGGCACTCCCCLHTLGAIAGAIVGSALPLSPPKQERYENAPEKPSPKVAAIFWALSGLVSLGVLGYYAVSGGAVTGDNLLGAGIILLLVGIPGAFRAALGRSGPCHLCRCRGDDAREVRHRTGGDHARASARGGDASGGGTRQRRPMTGCPNQ